MFCGDISGDAQAPQETRLTLPLQQAQDSKTEKEAERYNNGGTLCIMAGGDGDLWCHPISYYGT